MRGSPQGTQPTSPPASHRIRLDQNARRIVPFCGQIFVSENRGYRALFARRRHSVQFGGRTSRGLGAPHVMEDSQLGGGRHVCLVGLHGRRNRKESGRAGLLRLHHGRSKTSRDGRSDPASIAMGVAGACSGQYSQLSIQMQNEMITDKGQTYMQDQMRSNELRLATTAVLTYRSSQRDQQQK